MASKLRGADKAPLSCTRCLNRKQTCDRSLSHCLRCLSNSASCDYPQPRTPTDSLFRVESSPLPLPREPLFKSGPCGWDLTDHGQTELTKAMFAYHYPFGDDILETARLEERVADIFHDRGCTIKDLLESPVFEAFPLVAYDKLGGYSRQFELSDHSMPVLHLAILLVATPPCEHMPCSQTKKLYLVLKAWFAVLQTQLQNHIELIQIQGLIALYEYGHAMYGHSHISLNSAIILTSRIEVDFSIVETSLEWRLSLMLLDCLISLHKVERDTGWYPLACPPSHSVTRAVMHYLPVLSTPEGAPRRDKLGQRVLFMGQNVLQAGRILQHIHESKRNPRIIREDFDIMLKECLKTLHPASGTKDFASLVVAESVILSRICLLIHHAQISDLCHPGKNLESEKLRRRLQSLRIAASKSAKKVFDKYDDDDHEGASLPRIVCFIHVLSVIAKDPEGVTTKKEFVAMMAKVQEATKRWPAARMNFNQVAKDAGLYSFVRTERDAEGLLLLL